MLGENGAGKSTLMKIMIGLVLPDGGTISVRGQQAHITDPLVAADLGIAMVHQHYSLVDALTVWENVVLGESARLDPARPGAGWPRSVSATASGSIRTPGWAC